jgi:hypothetical protein
MKVRLSNEVPIQMSLSNPSLSANSMKSTTYLGHFQAFRGIFQGALSAIGKRKVRVTVACVAPLADRSRRASLCRLGVP